MVTMSPKGSPHDRSFDPNNLTARDVVVIVPFVIAFLALSTAFAFSVSDQVYVRWGGLVLDTSVLFALFVKSSRRFLRSGRFWSFTIVLLLLHLSAFALILTHVDQWKLVWFTPMAVEYPIFLFIRDKVLRTHDLSK